MTPVLFGDLRREMENLFEDFGRPFEGSLFRSTAAFPVLNVWEDAERLYAEAEIPGVSMEDVEVSVVGNELTLKGMRKPSQEGNMTIHRQERGTGVFSRFLTLPVAVNADKVEAVMKDGVLTITLPKADEAKPRRIEVKTQ
jgi:HSP20 family protein